MRQRSRRAAATLLPFDDGKRPEAESIMSTIEYAAKLTEVERLLNDPDTPMEPARVWSLLAELSENAALLPEKEGFGA